VVGEQSVEFIAAVCLPLPNPVAGKYPGRGELLHASERPAEVGGNRAVPVEPRRTLLMLDAADGSGNRGDGGVVKFDGYFRAIEAESDGDAHRRDRREMVPLLVSRRGSSPELRPAKSLKSATVSTVKARLMSLFCAGPQLAL
jgi:hypothetical protein